MDAIILNSSKAKELQTISPYCVEGNVFLPMNEQMRLQSEALLLTGDEAFSRKPFVVLPDASKLGIDVLKDRPIVLTRGVVKHIYKRHASDNQEPLSYNEITERLCHLDDELIDYVIAYEDPARKNIVCVVLNAISRGGNNIIVAVDFTTTVSHFEVNNIRTVHGKKNLIAIISKAKKAGRGVYPTKRTSDWFESSPEKPGETKPIA